jgi:hypothetical protein
MALSDRYLVSIPHDVWWGGWRSTTIQLQQAGWLLAAEQDCFNGSVQLALRHDRFGLRGLTEKVSVRYFERQRNERLMFRVAFMASAIKAEVVGLDAPQFENFRAIDARPQWVLRTPHMADMDELNIFAVPLVRTEEIIVDPNDVMAMLDRIKSLQSPEQAAIRERNRRRARDDGGWEACPQQQFHAQILSFAR